MRRICRHGIAGALLALAVCTQGAARELKSVLSRKRAIIQYSGSGRFRYIAPEQYGEFKDPVEPLGEGDLALFKDGLKNSEIKQLLEGYVKRMTAVYAKECSFPEELTKFLDKNAFAGEVFITALNPRYDDVAAAARVFDRLREKDERKLAKYAHLGTAFAVVYDTPDAAASSRYYGIWGWNQNQFSEPLSYENAYAYYSSSSNKSRLSFAMDKLPWPILVHLVDNEVSEEEWGWAIRKYNRSTNVERLYPAVPYDEAKLARVTPRLGNRAYNLPNILQYGGVCGDQAHFMSRVSKCLGIPAMKVTGESRYGGIGHAWAGFLVIRQGRPLLEFTGRYFHDYYYTGDVFDPQTRTLIMDRYIAMMYDGASLSYEKYNQSQMMVRMAEALQKEHPQESLELTTEALKLNFFNMWGWPLLMTHIKNGTMKKNEGMKWFNDSLRVLKEHPDMTYECLNTFIDCLPKSDVKGRQLLYTQAFALYKTRPDLQLKLRMSQAEELVAAGEKVDSINLLCATIVEHSKEGALILPAMQLAVKIARELNVKPQAYAILKNAEKTFPKQRFNTISQAYLEFQQLLRELN